MAAIILTTFGQVFMKQGMIELSGFSMMSPSMLWAMFCNVWILAGILCYCVSSVAWLAALSKLELSFAYPFMSFGFVLVTFMSWIFFHERISLLRLVGVLIIVIGVVIISRK